LDLIIDEMLKSRWVILFGTVGFVLTQILNTGVSEAFPQSWIVGKCAQNFDITGNSNQIDAVKIYAKQVSTDQAIASAALQWTRISFIVRGTPKVILIRSVTIEDLSKLGLSEGAGVNTQGSLKLVIIKGEFDLSTLRGGFSSKKEKVKASYVGYVFDLEAGLPMATLTSKNGGRFRKALNQPNLPDDVLPDEPRLQTENSTKAVLLPVPAL
jgi:hypothetical protein